MALLIFPSAVQAEDCEFTKNIELSLDLSGTDTLAILAGAGSLKVYGNSGTDEASLTGKACASSEEWLEESTVNTREGDLAKIEVELPDTGNSWSLFGDNYAYIDLELNVPENMKLDVVDSSGSIVMENVGELSLTDSSGSIKLEGVNGPLRLKDSSGSIRMNDVDGDVTIIADSSGSMAGDNIEGSVLVKRDSSGSIKFTDVSGDFTVERDSSGSITAERIGGDFTVLKDGSGGIRTSEVAGEVSTPSD
jgi:DUF4097 and DUF4098 domain-containing protein YvlB